MHQLIIEIINLFILQNICNFYFNVMVKQWSNVKTVVKIKLHVTVYIGLGEFSE